MKKTALIITILSLFAISLTAQENTQEFTEFVVPGFTGIDVGGLSNVYITNGSIQSLKMEKSENEDERNATFIVKNGILEIKQSMDESDNNIGNEKIYITCPNLNSIKASGISKIKSQNTILTESLSIKASGASKIEMTVDVKTLKTDISGAAKLNLKGNSIQHIAKLSGAANLNAKELNVFNMGINGSGASKASVNVKSKIYGEMTGISAVNYENKPDTILLNNENINENDDFSANHFKNKNSMGTDTTKLNILGNEMEIIEGKNTKVSIGKTELTVDENGNIKIGKKDKNKAYSHRFRGHWAGFELAFNGYVNKDFGTELPTQYNFLKFDDVKSIGVNLNLLELNANIINNRFGVVSGFGFQWNNYRFDDNVVLLPDSGRIYGYYNTNITSYIKSKLVESWVRLPLFLEYQTAKKKNKQFHLAVGGVFGYKLGSHSKQVHFEGGDRTKPKVYNDFYLNPIKLDAEVRIGWGPVNLFASYALTPMYKDNKGPELYPYMLGLTLASW